MIACKRGDVRRKPQHKTHVHVLKVETYQLSRLIKVMVADVHLVLGHALEGLPIQVAGEGDGVHLNTSRHRYLEESREEVEHDCDRRLPLVKGAPAVNDFSGNLWTMSHLFFEKQSHSYGRTYEPSISRLGSLALRGPACNPGREQQPNDYLCWSLHHNSISIG